MGRISLADGLVMFVAQLPTMVVVAVASWMVQCGDLPMVDRCVLDALGDDGALDPLAFAALYAAEHERYWGAPWALPQGACAIDGATGRATLLVPRELVDAPCEANVCKCPECEAINAQDSNELAAEAGLRGRWSGASPIGGLS